MKKHRRKAYRLDPEIAYYVKASGRKKTHERSTYDVFLRLNNRQRTCNAKHFAAAGYPMAVLKSGVWNEVHKWCAENFRDNIGRTYCWTGEKFWFQTEADKAKFVAKWG